MDEDRWAVVRFLRRYYDDFAIEPAMRVLVRAMGEALGAEKGNSRYLYRLFPEGPIRQASKIAGLPKPASCT